MAQSPEGSSEQETGVDVFEHEMAELEQSAWKDKKMHVLAVALGALAVTISLGAGFFILTKTTTRSERAVSTIMTIEAVEPRGGRLAARPTRFAWESISNAKSYVVTMREQGGDTDLIVRETTNTSIELTSSEAARLVMGGNYVWRVRAGSQDGWTIAEGGGTFSL